MNDTQTIHAEPLPILHIERFSAVDAGPLFDLIDRNREHLSQWGDDTAKKYPTLESVLKSITNPPDPARLRFGIWEKHALLGTINLTPERKAPGCGSIGYYLDKEHTGRGIMTQVLKYMMIDATRNHKLKILLAQTRVENIPSQNVLKRCGFESTRVEQKIRYWQWKTA